MRWGSAKRRDTPATLLAASVADADAFHDFYRAYVRRVAAYFARRVCDAEAAMDLTGETFALALERCAQFRGTTAEEEQGWLFAIARSQLHAFYRRGEVERAALARLKLDAPSATEADLEWVERVADMPALRATVAQALAELPADQADAVSARILHERTYAEIAAELAVSEVAVRARVSRGIRALAPILDSYRLLDVT